MSNLELRVKEPRIKRKLTVILSDTRVKDIDITLLAKDILQDLRDNK